MDYEKLHKYTINKLQQMVNSGEITVEIARGICADFVPESDDERIRKEILDFCKNRAEKYSNDPKYKNISAWIAWLEKQGKKGANGNEREFPISEPKPAWSEEDEKISSAIIKRLKGSDALSVDLQRAICWIDHVKDRVLPQPKQKWSGEDERIIDNLISQLGNLFARKLIKEETKDKYVNWLKSLRPQSHWKPSNEQIEALLKLEEMHVLEHEKKQENAHLYMVVKSIREQLLKLREE